MEKPEPLPCPFCGGKATACSSQRRYSFMSAVECLSCGANTGPVTLKEADAIAKWNRRVPGRSEKLWDEFGLSPTVIEPKRKRK